MSQAPRHRLLGFDREDNEIADFVDDRAECVAADALGRFPQLLRALAGAGALVQQRTDIDWFSIRPAQRGSAARGPANQLRERRWSHPRGD